jgi:anti-anti-sigma factor
LRADWDVVAAVDEASPAEALTAHSRDADGTDVVTISGELDMSNVELVREQLARVVGDALPRLVFDLSDLRFMDSSGIALLIQVTSRTGQVSLRNASPLIRRVLEATGVAGILPVEP